MNAGDSHFHYRHDILMNLHNTFQIWGRIIGIHMTKIHHYLHLKFLFRCPLLLDLDIRLYTDHFIQLGLVVLAVGTALLLPGLENQQEALSNILINPNDCIDVLTQLSDWIQAGKVVPSTQQVCLNFYETCHTNLVQL